MIPALQEFTSKKAAVAAALDSEGEELSGAEEDGSTLNPQFASNCDARHGVVDAECAPEQHQLGTCSRPRISTSTSTSTRTYRTILGNRGLASSAGSSPPADPGAHHSGLPVQPGSATMVSFVRDVNECCWLFQAVHGPLTRPQCLDLVHHLPQKLTHFRTPLPSPSRPFRMMLCIFPAQCKYKPSRPVISDPSLLTRIPAR